MQQFGLSNKNECISLKKGFFRRQFQGNATKPQKSFDWIFGVILPVICFVFDPIVFKSSTFGAAFLGDYKPSAYILSFISVMAMSGWLIWGEKLKLINAFLAGLFFTCGLISLCIGILLFPISLLGLMIVIGILGFTPLFTAIVFFRNSWRAFGSVKPFLAKRVLVNSFVLSALLSLVIPSVINAEIRKALDAMTNGDAKTIRTN